MTAGLESGSRHLIPRWRSVRRTVEAGEFQQLDDRRPFPAGLESGVPDAHRRWVEVQDQVSAAELVGAALVADEMEQAKEAASLLKESGENPLLRGLGERAIDSGSTAGFVDPPLRTVDQAFEQHIASLLHQDRIDAVRDPRNPIAWAAMARRYTILGHLEQAERCLLIALSLAPTSRYMHRIATRFFVHANQPDRAHQLLFRFERTQSDPWLLAALLAVANSAELPVHGVRQARRLVEEESFRHRERSELASELGTMDFSSGHERRARRLFEWSLQEPTDNSLAQAEWASQRLLQLDVGLEGIEVPFAAEAHALATSQNGEWEDSLRHSEQWLDDQPFDVRASVHGSYVSAVALERWDESIALSRVGLRSRPGHPLLCNNLAFALIGRGSLDEAEQVLGGVDWATATNTDRTALIATQGLLAFRRGDPNRGLALYEESISRARRSRSDRQEAMAEANLIREAIRLHLSKERVAPEVANLRALAKGIQDKAVLLVVARAEDTLAQD